MRGGLDEAVNVLSEDVFLPCPGAPEKGGLWSFSMTGGPERALDTREL